MIDKIIATSVYKAKVGGGEKKEKKKRRKRNRRGDGKGENGGTPPPPPPTRFSVKRCYCTRVLTRDKIRFAPTGQKRAKKYIRSLCELRLRLFARKRRKISDIDTSGSVRSQFLFLYVSIVLFTTEFFYVIYYYIFYVIYYYNGERMKRTFRTMK